MAALGTTERVRVAAVNDFKVIVAGLAALLERFPDRLLVCDRIVVGERLRVPVDVALYDTYGRVGIAADALKALAGSPDIARVAVFTTHLTDEMVEHAFAAGASGVLSKGLRGEEIADALLAIAVGEQVVARAPSSASLAPELDWPGKVAGLTARQSQVLALAAEGLLQEGHQAVHRHLQEPQNGPAGSGINGDVPGLGFGEHRVRGEGQGFHPGRGLFDLRFVENNDTRG